MQKHSYRAGQGTGFNNEKRNKKITAFHHRIVSAENAGKCCISGNIHRAER